MMNLDGNLEQVNFVFIWSMGGKLEYQKKMEVEFYQFWMEKLLENGGKLIWPFLWLEKGKFI